MSDCYCQASLSDKGAGDLPVALNIQREGWSEEQFSSPLTQVYFPKGMQPSVVSKTNRYFGIGPKFLFKTKGFPLSPQSQPCVLLAVCYCFSL